MTVPIEQRAEFLSEQLKKREAEMDWASDKLEKMLAQPKCSLDENDSATVRAVIESLGPGNPRRKHGPA